MNTDTLNDKQLEAVHCTEGPLLILAGAGSGKTRVLTHRIAYLIDDLGVDPWNILAITFTNKAAGEMRERVDRLVKNGAENVWVSTFHSLCVRILRRYIRLLGYDTNFTIYDTDDQKTIMKEVCKSLQIDTKQYRERSLLSSISRAKDELITPEEFREQAGSDFAQRKIADVYEEYERQLKANNALDFDDLLMKTVQLFQAHPDVLESYQDRFRYILVDEYQDTNTAQFELISLLSKKYRNLCVVGDDDQSIYKFRGANIMNILSFEKVFPDATVIKLEQNYRSTGNILNAANEVIRHNKGRKSKTLWTDKDAGDKISLKQLETAYDEAEYVADDIRTRVDAGTCTYHDNAILYRTNAQSRMFEEKFVADSIPYKIIGGVNFYSRREIKDLLAYLKTVDNGQDDLSVRRILNVPKRGIGLTTINRVQAYAQEKGLNLYEALKNAQSIPGIGRSAAKLDSFVSLIEHFKADAQDISVSDLMEEILDETGYEESLLDDETEEEAKARVENIDELMSKIVSYEETCADAGEEATLTGFLADVALVADIDSLDEDSDYVVLMTLHSAKGLEFPHVYLAGMEDGVFPSYLTITSDDKEELEEERRLCYVGITRAQQELTMTCARQRMVRGETQHNPMSRFLKEIPEELLSADLLPKRFEDEDEDDDWAEQDLFGGGRSGMGGSRQSSYNGSMWQSGTGSTQWVGSGTPRKSGGSLRQPAQKPYQTAKGAVKQFGSPEDGALDYQVGDRVRHVKFGDGTVTGIVRGGRDYEVTVDFDSAGTKKMFAAFAKLVKI